MVTAVSRFRLFGRPDADTPADGECDADALPVPRQRSSPPPPSWGRPAPTGPPPVGAGAAWPTGSWPAPSGAAHGPTSGAGRAANGTSPRAAEEAWSAAPGPATRSARPAVALTSRDPRVVGDPPTDPYGFPPVPAFAPAAPDPAEAAALAAAFAADYLSWDEDDPERRGRVLIDYLPTPGRDPARLGWSGQGRQRTEFTLPGLVRPDGDGRVLVDVRVRVTPYRAVGEHGPSADADPKVPGVDAAAPAPTGRGWRSLASTWIRLSVPVTLDGGRLVVDAWEETLGEEPPARSRPVVTGDDHTLADDDPLQDPLPEVPIPQKPLAGGAW